MTGRAGNPDLPVPPIATVRRMIAPGDPAIDAVVRIYTDAIPAAERKPVEWLRGIVTATEPGGSAASSSRLSYQLLVAERGSVAVGFAVLFTPANPGDAALLEYLGVAEDARGLGVGGDLFRACRTEWPGPMLVEVDAAGPDADRRRRFYRRHGCLSVIGLQYKLPLPGAGPMGLMIAGADAVGRDELRRWITAIYSQVYAQPADDPRIAGMVDGLAETVGLEPGLIPSRTFGQVM